MLDALVARFAVPALIALAVAAACAGGYAWVLAGRLELAQARAKTLTTQLDAANAATELLKAENTRLQGRADDAARKAAVAVKRAQERATAISKAPVPSTCDGAVQWAAEQGKALGSW